MDSRLHNSGCVRMQGGGQFGAEHRGTHCMICMTVIEKHCLGARSQENEGSGSKRPKPRH